MKKLSNNPIDHYFRKNLESPDLNYSDQDWKGMEVLLSRTPASRNRRMVWASAAAAIVILFSFLWLLNADKIENTTPGKEKAEIAASSENYADSSSRDRIEKNNNQAGSKLVERLTPVAQKSKSYRSNSTPKKEKGIVADKTIESPDRWSNLLTAKASAPGSDITLEANQASLSSFINSAKAKLIALSALNDESKQQKSISDAEKMQWESNRNADSRFSLAVNASPDLNSISGSSKNSLGGSLGLRAIYRLSSRLDISTGITYSNKEYSALPIQYNAPWARSDAGRFAKSIDADCRVLDVPVNISYSFSQNTNRTFFISTGLSSYFMLRERYTLVSAAPKPGFPVYENRSYAYQGDNKHLLGVLNLSAGVKKPLDKRTTLSVEPYTRLPLNGIGQGKVRLKSVGVNFQVQYNFNAKRKLKPASLNAFR